MANMFIVPGWVDVLKDDEGNYYYDISGMDYREVEIGDIPQYAGGVSGNEPVDFDGATSYTSDAFNNEIAETAFIAIAPGQKINKMTDVVVLIGGSQPTSYIIISKENSDLNGGNLSSGVCVAPWLFVSYNGAIGYIGWNGRDNEWHMIVIGNYTTGARVTAFYSLSYAGPPITGISIRCPDSVVQGSYIMVSCDSPERSYVEFTCTMSGNTSSRTKLIQSTERTIRLQCGSDEAAGSVSIEVAGLYSPKIKASKAITVIPFDGGGGNGGGDGGGDGGGGDGSTDTSQVTDISLHAFPEKVVPGEYALIVPSVNGVGNYSHIVTADITGQTSDTTCIMTDGFSCNLWVSKDETAQSILVTVTSAENPAVSATATIAIDHSGTTVEPGEEEQLRQMYWKGFAAAKAHLRKLHFTETATVSVTKDGEPTTTAGKLKRAFWKGFVAGATLTSEKVSPLEFFYGHVAKEGETPTHTIDGVDYVGVIAPKIPVVEGYDFAYIGKNKVFGQRLFLYVSKYPFYVNSEGKFVSDNYYGLLVANNVSSKTSWKLNEVNWESTSSGNPAIWANYDITNQDGAVYLEKSSPFPI